MTATAGFLSPYRVLDLTDERGLLAGRMLAQLGADVIQIEPIDGSSARRVGPFDEGAPDGENSFYWSAYAAGKRGVACQLGTDAGRALLRQLVAKADFVIESCDPDVRAAWGLSPAGVQAINPAVIHVSISAFGSDGPKADYAASDLTVWAAGGPLLPSRDGERPPLRISLPQAFLNAAADAAGGALIAHFARLQNGRGQHVDVSAQQAAALCTLAVSLAAPVGHPDFSIPGTAGADKKESGNDNGGKKNAGRKKELDLSGSGSRTRRSKWQVRDGLVEMHIGLGPAGGRFANNLFQWLHREGACDDDIAAWDWVMLPQRIIADEVKEEDLERARACVANFFIRFTKDELLEKAMELRFLCAPVATTRDLLDSRQLADRQFFQTVTESSGSNRTLPGNFAAGMPEGFVPLTPAPALGQHTVAVLSDWLGLKETEIDLLRKDGAIA